jgi:hypothetical protein
MFRLSLRTAAKARTIEFQNRKLGMRTSMMMPARCLDAVVGERKIQTSRFQAENQFRILAKCNISHCWSNVYLNLKPKGMCELMSV